MVFSIGLMQAGRLRYVGLSAFRRVRLLDAGAVRPSWFSITFSGPN